MILMAAFWSLKRSRGLTRPLSKNQKLALGYGIGADFGKNIIEKMNYNEITFDKKYYVYNFPQIPYFSDFQAE